MLAGQLPLGAQVWVSLGSDRAWTAEAHNIAHAVDALNGANWQRGGGKGPKPDPLPRPAAMAESAARTARHLARARRFRERQAQREG